jgi:hypothetical protein
MQASREGDVSLTFNISKQTNIYKAITAKMNKRQVQEDSFIR